MSNGTPAIMPKKRGHECDEAHLSGKKLPQPNSATWRRSSSRSRRSSSLESGGFCKVIGSDQHVHVVDLLSFLVGELVRSLLTGSLLFGSADMAPAVFTARAELPLVGRELLEELFVVLEVEEADGHVST